MYVAKAVMTENVISISAAATVQEAIRLLVRHRISGAPVVDEAQQLVGIISEFQLMEIVFEPDLKSRPVADFMTKDVITVGEGALLSEVVSLFVVHRIRRLPVVRNGTLVGLIARRDVLAYADQHWDELKHFVTRVQILAAGNYAPR
jgi:CBS domain-containing protein